MSAGAAGELPYGRFAAVEQGRDVGVRVAERLAQHEHRAFQRGEGLQDDEDGEGDGVGEHGLFGGVRDGVAEVGDVRLRQPRADVRLAARLDLAQPVDGEAGGDAHQVAARFAYAGPVAARPAQPRVLHDVLGVGDPAQHAVGDPEEDGAVCFEDVGRGVGGHGTIPADPRGRVQAAPAAPGHTGLGATRR
ncbi:hypothetical protein SHKM778_59850 [Streptomyces sp. KM77-8]|uniref:Uncharacterized protein n=1 Tax=Streptomyces haneummycinicus TaxID=3074435 RepID=A0AAT9HQR6_9ACTN